ncbi:GNAT family N-acetyltransferase [Pantoea sp. 1.19]|uniref:GNAT family N-acetyltransferase n=1 Tax=Pantoea sp. 1.19 TaxID=1925589 RepID=UPI000948E1BE|nr:GNAT family N-acetyltransferase [Pantoea sp. 1.19]
MSLTALTHLRALPAAEWDALLPSPQPFLRHAFLSALEESGSLGPRSGWAPCHLLWHAQGRLCAAVPGYVKGHSMGEYVFDQRWAEASEQAGIPYYPKWLGAVPFSPIGGARLLGDANAAAALLTALPDFLAQRQLMSAHLNFIDATAHTLLAAQPARWLSRIGYQYHWHNRGYRDFQDFLDALSSRKRKQIRKERQRVREQGITFRWLDVAQAQETDWDTVYRCYANTYAVRGRAPYLTRTFFSLLAERMPEAIRVVFAERAGRPLAMAWSLVDDATFYGRYWGCKEEVDGLHFETCFWQGIEATIASGRQHFNAGAQGEHKLLRGFEPVLTHSWHLLRHPGLAQAVEAFLARERPAVRAWADEARAALPYRLG